MNNLLPKIVGAYLNLLSYISSDYAASRALHLFCTPRKGKIIDKHLEFLNSAKTRKLFYKDIPIMTYQWEGNGETILLVHGWESNTARWKKKIRDFLKDGYSVVALDAPAHGDSGSNIFNAILYSEFINVVANQFNPQIIIGHSVGGMATVFFQHKYQLQSLKKLVLLGAPSEFSDVLKRYVDMLGYNKKLEKHLKRLIFERFGAYPEHFSTSKLIGEISAEGLIIHDTKDPVIPFSDAQLIAENYTNAKLVSTTGFGHSLNNKEVTKTILDFINP